MGNHPRKAAGRRVLSAEFKRTTVQRVLTGEKTVVELSRELDIAPSVVRTWARRSEAGATTAVAANEDVVPASPLRSAPCRESYLMLLLPRPSTPVAWEGRMATRSFTILAAILCLLGGCALGHP